MGAGMSRTDLVRDVRPGAAGRPGADPRSFEGPRVALGTLETPMRAKTPGCSQAVF